MYPTATALKGGTRLTRNLCALLERPFILINAAETPDPFVSAEAVLKFVEENNVVTLNVAGQRASGWPAGYRFARDVVNQVISRLASDLPLEISAARTARPDGE